MYDTSEITRLLAAAASGDRQAAADLLPLVYDELRRLAAARMAAERPGHTLDATALVPEAYRSMTGSSGSAGSSVVSLMLMVSPRMVNEHGSGCWSPSRS